MSQTLVFILLVLALVLPVLGAVILRILVPRLSQPWLYGSAVLIFGAAIASVLLLARANVTSIRVGELSLLLPAAVRADEAPTADQTSDQVVAPPTAGQQPAPSSPPTEAAPSIAPTAIPTAAPSIAPATAPPTVLTATPTTTPTATLEPATPAPPTTAPTAPARRTYVVQKGDTLRSIAEKFSVSVQALLDANKLTPAQADSLRVGQELVIP
jgi:LysM repeat protein